MCPGAPSWSMAVPPSFLAPLPRASTLPSYFLLPIAAASPQLRSTKLKEVGSLRHVWVADVHIWWEAWAQALERSKLLRAKMGLDTATTGSTHYAVYLGKPLPSAQQLISQTGDSLKPSPPQPAKSWTQWIKCLSYFDLLRLLCRNKRSKQLRTTYRLRRHWRVPMMPAPMPSRMAAARYLSSSELYMALIFLGFFFLCYLVDLDT